MKNFFKNKKTRNTAEQDLITVIHGHGTLEIPAKLAVRIYRVFYTFMVYGLTDNHLGFPGSDRTRPMVCFGNDLKRIYVEEE